MQLHPSRFRHRLFRGALVALAAATLAGQAAAQRRSEWEVGLSKHGRGGHIEVSIGNRGVHVSGGRHPNARRPVVHRPAPAGHWETRVERVWVPGPVRKVWVPPLYETRYDHCGRPYQVCVRHGFWDTIQEQGCWENRETRVWVPCHTPHPYHPYRAISGH